MFIKIETAQKETILINSSLIESIVRQMDGDVYIHMQSGGHYKVKDSAFDALAQILKAERQ